MFLSWIIVLVIIFLVGYLLLGYNGLIRKRNQVKEAWSDIDVQLKRRYELIPNLVATVKGYAAHERSTLDSVTSARAQAISAKTPTEQASAESQLTSTLKSLFAVAESYPDLKANTNFLELQRELSDTENKIQAARRFYNTTVLEYNTALETIPTAFFGNMLGFKKSDFFQLEDEQARSVPKVSF